MKNIIISSSETIYTLMKKRMNIKQFLPLCYAVLSITIALTFTQCTSDPEIVVPDVSNIEASPQLFRLDSIFALSDLEKALNEVEKFQEKHPEFSKLYFNQVLRINVTPENPQREQLKGFFSSEQGKKVISKVSDKYADLDFLRKELSEALKYYQHYFPDQDLPNFYTFLSEYTLQVFLFEDENKTGVGIGLDLFLAPEMDYKNLDPRNPAFSNYLTRTYKKEYITKKVMEALIGDLLTPERGSSLLEQIIQEGKKSYILKKILPYAPDSIVFEQTQKQMEWLENNELEMWSFFLEEDLLYETSVRETMKYTKPRPDSPGMPEEAPGRTGNYLGHKIVTDYMKKNPTLKLQDLLKTIDAQEMLDSYRPRRK